MANFPLIPIVNDPTLYLDGMFLKYDSNTGIQVANGAARSQDNTNDIVVTSGTNKVTGDDKYTFYTLVNLANIGVLNGIEAALVNNGTYHVYAIASSANLGLGYTQNNLTFNPATNGMTSTAIPVPASSTPPGFFVSLTNVELGGPIMPAGYDIYRRIGSFRTDGSAHVIPFRQDGINTDRTIHFESAIDISLNQVTPTSGTYPTLTTGWPSTAITWSGTVDLWTIVPASIDKALVDVVYAATATDLAFVALRAQNSIAPYGYDWVTLGSSAAAWYAQLEVPVDLTQDADPHPQIKYAFVSASGTLAIRIAGYVDNL